MSADVICGKCEVVCGEDIEGDKDDWFTSEADRFYFFEAYNSNKKTFTDPPPDARAARSKGKVSRHTPVLSSDLYHVCCREKGKGKERAKLLLRELLLLLTHLSSLYGHWMSLLVVEVCMWCV